MLRLKQQIDMKWQVKPTLELNKFFNYSVHILRPQNIEISAPYWKNIGDKTQDNNEIILHKNIINSIWNQITDNIQGF